LKFPIRCFTCGKIIGHLYPEYAKRIKSEQPKDVLDNLGIKRYCCRRIFLAHVDISSEILPFNEYSNGD
jgi:DNA-directed RNA polymerase subunit N